MKDKGQQITTGNEALEGVKEYTYLSPTISVNPATEIRNLYRDGIERSRKTALL